MNFIMASFNPASVSRDLLRSESSVHSLSESLSNRGLTDLPNPDISHLVSYGFRLQLSFSLLFSGGFWLSLDRLAELLQLVSLPCVFDFYAFWAD